MLEPEVQILLSTFNGASFLEAQIESLLSQSFQNWQLLIRDDGSTDQTLTIINSYKEAHPKKVVIIKNENGGSSTKSFMSLLNSVSAPYIMFCDQDDVWLPAKIENSLTALKRIEKKHPVSAVYCDMRVVNSELETISPSFLKSQSLNPIWCAKPYSVFAQSMAAGCSMIFTKTLADRLHPIDSLLFQHDHWILMHAANYGKIGFLDNILINYRQHADNAIGSHKIGMSYFGKKVKTTRLVWTRWKYIKSQYQPSPSIIKIAIEKVRINLLRLLGRQ